MYNCYQKSKILAEQIVSRIRRRFIRIWQYIVVYAKELEIISSIVVVF